MVEKSGIPAVGLFPSQRKAEPPPVERPSVDVSELAGRLRIYEGRYGELRKNMLVIEQNMLSHYKKTDRELKSIYSELSELRRQIIEIQDKITVIIRELQLLATKSEVKVLARVLDYIDPVKFVRIDRIESIVNDIVDAREQEGDKEESVPKTL